jgi:hypothetical protein
LRSTDVRLRQSIIWLTLLLWRRASCACGNLDCPLTLMGAPIPEHREERWCARQDLNLEAGRPDFRNYDVITASIFVILSVCPLRLANNMVVVAKRLLSGSVREIRATTTAVWGTVSKPAPYDQKAAKNYDASAVKRSKTLRRQSGNFYGAKKVRNTSPPKSFGARFLFTVWRDTG